MTFAEGGTTRQQNDRYAVLNRDWEETREGFLQSLFAYMRLRPQGVVNKNKKGLFSAIHINGILGIPSYAGANNIKNNRIQVIIDGKYSVSL